MLRWKVMGYAAVALGSDCGGTGRDQAALLWSLGRKNRDLDDDAHLRYVYVGEGEAWEKDSHRVLEEELQKKGIRTECVAELKDGKGLEAALTEQLNARGKALELVVCSGDDIAEDIPKIAERAGRTPGRDLVIIGAGADDDVLKLIIKGRITGTVYRDVLTESKSVAAAAAQLCALEIPDNAVVPGISVTSVNAQEIRDYRESFLRSK